MSVDPIKILLLDDDEDDFVLIRSLLTDCFDARLRLEWAETFDQAMRFLEAQTPDLCLCDYRLGECTGLDFLKKSRQGGWDFPIIVLTGQGDHDIDLAAMRAGAEDYLLKADLNAELLERSVRYALERHRSARALRDSELRFRQLAEASHEGVIIHEDRRILDVNPSMCRLFGWSWEEFIGSDPLDYLAPESRDLARERLTAPNPEPFVAVALRRDAARFPVEIVGGPIPYQGRTVRVTSLRDISQQKKEEEILRQQLSRIDLLNRIARAVAEREDMSSIFEVALDRLQKHLAVDFGAFYLLGQDSGRIQLAALNLKPGPAGSAAGRFDPGAIQWADAFLACCLKGEMEYQEDLSTDSQSWAAPLVNAGVRSLVVAPMLADNRAFAVMLAGRAEPRAFAAAEREFLRTLSEHICLAARHASLHADLRQAYERLKDSQEAAVRQERLAAVGQLAAGVAHEFNNILTIIQGYSNLLLATYKVDSEMQTALQNIAGGSERAARLVSQLLAFSRKQVLQAHSLDLNQVVENLMKILAQVIEENIRLHCRLEPDLPQVHADAAMLEQIVMNLAVNARDAMPGGGELHLSTRSLRVDDQAARRHLEAKAGDYVCLEVADTGCGMTPEVLARIFEPFFTTKEIGKGTGLGLATVYGLVKQHQGWIEAESRPGSGSTFRVFIPALTGDKPQPAVPAGPSIHTGGRERLLIVEDEPNLRNLVCEVLRQYGYQAIGALDGPSALKAWHECAGQVDLLLTDIVMPGGLNGIELAKALRREKPALKVVFTSGYSVDLKDDCFARFQAKFLQKPYRPGTLLEVVRQCLDAD